MAEAMTATVGKVVRASKIEGKSGHKTTSINKKSGSSLAPKPEFTRAKGAGGGERETKRRTTVIDKETGKAIPATPFKNEIVFLTAEQQARRDELAKKNHTTVAERDELRELNSGDPYKKYEEIEKRVDAGKATPEDKEFAERFEKTDEYKAKEEAEAFEDLLKDERAGLLDSHGVLEILASEGEPGVVFEQKGRKLGESKDDKDRATGLDMQYEGLIMQRGELQKAMDDEGKPLSSRHQKKNEDKLKQVETKLENIKAERQKITSSNPELAENQFAGMARALVPGKLQEDGSGNVLALKSVNDYFDRLTHATQDQRVGVLHDWKLKGVPDNISETLQRILFKEEIAMEHKDKIKSGIKKTSIILLLFAVIGPLMMAKKASTDNQPGGR